MRDYSKVSGTFWTGKTGKALRGDFQAQVVALYLMTSPHANMIGVFHCPLIYIAHETGSPIEGALEGLQRLCNEAFCTYDEENETVWVHEMARFQVGDSLKATDKQVLGIQKQYDTMPEGRIKSGFFEKYSEAFCITQTNKTSKPLASPLQAPPKPEAGTGTGTGEENTFVAGKPTTALCPQKEILTLYAEVLPELPQPRAWEGAREKNLTARWRWVLADLKAKGKPHDREAGLDFFRRMFGYIHDSDFLMGRAGTWSADLGWIVKAEPFAKILQGNYENKEKAA